jgi:hypothetical protein
MASLAATITLPTFTKVRIHTPGYPVQHCSAPSWRPSSIRGATSTSRSLSPNPSLQRTPPVRFRTLGRLAATVNGFVNQTQRVR